jgi:hypothetical protein
VASGDSLAGKWGALDFVVLVDQGSTRPPSDGACDQTAAASSASSAGLSGIDADDVVADRASEIEDRPSRATGDVQDAGLGRQPEAAERDAPLVLRGPAVLAHVFSVRLGAHPAPSGGLEAPVGSVIELYLSGRRHRDDDRAGDLRACDARLTGG